MTERKIRMRISRKWFFIVPLVLLLLGLLALMFAASRNPERKMDRIGRDVKSILESVTDNNGVRGSGLPMLIKAAMRELRSFLMRRNPSMAGGSSYVSKYDVFNKIHDKYGQEAVPALLDALKSHPRPEVREAAAYVIGNGYCKETDVQAAAVLTKAMTGDREPQVRAEAARCLKYLKTDDNIDNLLSVFKNDRDDEVRSAAAETLGRLRAAKAVPEFISFLGTIKEADKTSSSASANGGFPGRRAFVSSFGKYTVYESVAGALKFARDPAVVPALIAAIKDVSDESFRSRAISTLEVYHEKGVYDFVLEMLKSAPEQRARESAARSLRNFEDFGALDALCAALDSESAGEVKMAIAESLEDLGSRAGVPFVLEELKSGGADRRSGAIRLLGRLAVAEAEPELVSILQEQDGSGESSNMGEYDRESAAEALGNLRLDSSIPALITASEKDSKPRVRAAAVEALGNFNGPKVHEFLLKTLDSGDSEISGAAASALGSIGRPEDSAVLVSMLKKSSNKKLQKSLVQALGEMCDPAAADLILPLLDDKDKDLQDASCWALGHIGEPRAVEALAGILSGKDGNACFAASFALAEIGDPRAAPFLEKAKWKDGDENASLAVKCALAFLNRPEVVLDLEGRLREPDSADWQRFAAICALMRLDTDDALKVLKENGDDQVPEFRELVRRNLAGEGVNALKCTLQSKKSDHRQYSARILMFFDDIPPEILSLLDEMGGKDQAKAVRDSARMAAKHIRHREELKKAGLLPAASIKGK